jgi:two-component system, chemotaxis family, response regulator WspF
MKIGIVNDLRMAGEALRRAIALRPAHQVVWVAYDGAEAVAMCAREPPDLVLMDLIMPGMDGVEATRQIMARTPCAILIVTASTGANAGRVFDAMGYGALDAVDTPSFQSGETLASASPLLAKIDRIGRMVGNKNSDGMTAMRVQGTSPATKHPLVVIGASAGGPAALMTLLSGLPRTFPAGIVIVQHVDAQFAAGMADWLNGHSALPVRVAKEGDEPLLGSVLLASTGDHLVLKTATHLGYSPDPRDHAYRPSVDVFFHSVCRLWRGPTVGVLLTGMGRDGAVGLKALRDKGYHTITQDRASSAVYGMPKAAASISAATDILPLAQIAPTLTRILASDSVARRGASL